MSGTCSYVYEDAGYDDECMILCTEKIVSARKKHGCDECGQPIFPDEKYGRLTGLYDGQWHTLRRCPSCLILAEWAATVRERCPQWPRLAEFIEELPEALPSPREFREKYDAKRGAT